MADSEHSEEGLSSVFDKALELHDQVEVSTDDSTSEKFQDKVKKCILMLEDCTRLVSLLNLFSRNESYTEVVTEHLKYFLLPVLLGDMNTRLTGTERSEVVETCQIYYIDFLQRAQDYEFTDVKVPDLKTVKVDGAAETNGQPPGRPGPPDLARMNRERDAKMARFREKKELEGEIKSLKALVNPGTRDEDLERKLYINMIKRFIHIAQDELDSLQMEVDVLRYMSLAKAGQIPEQPKRKSRPFKPIIITKDKLQKEVYGLGYPSLPVLSVDEFYEQRVKEGWFPPASQSTSLQDTALNPEAVAQQQEEELREQEDKEDRDDQQEIDRQRAKDEWKDEHRRGEGNRHNMG